MLLQSGDLLFTKWTLSSQSSTVDFNFLGVDAVATLPTTLLACQAACAKMNADVVQPMCCDETLHGT